VQIKKSCVKGSN